MPTETIQGLEHLTKKLKTLENFQRAMKAPMELSLSVMHDYIAVAPRKKAGAFTKWAKPQQRRWYWWAVKEGKIGHDENGYKRTNVIKNSWTKTVDMHSNGVTGEVGTIASGAKYVQGKDDQQPFHKASGWRTDSETLEKYRPNIKGFFEDAINKELNK